jgi:curved DNA-binding protein CbpA
MKLFNKKTNLYNLIGLNKNASKNDIRSASLKAMRQFHPDVYNHKFAKSKFREINNVYKILTTESTKNNYDNLSEKEKSDHFKLWMNKYEHYDTFSRRLLSKLNQPIIRLSKFNIELPKLKPVINTIEKKIIYVVNRYILFGDGGTMIFLVTLLFGVTIVLFFNMITHPFTYIFIFAFICGWLLYRKLLNNEEKN